MKKILFKKRGFSLVEMLIYVSILSIFTVAMVSVILSFTQSYRTLLALRNVDNTAIDAMERMSRDIRNASSIDTANSTLGSNPGVLTLVSTSGSLSTTTKFYLQGGVLKMDVNGSYYGPLSVGGSSVTKLIFTKLSSSISSAVKIDLTITSTVGPIIKTKQYHATVMLKGA
jgi:prepilin-type N-terminal cleavage/methylation domain-containing protein